MQDTDAGDSLADAQQFVNDRLDVGVVCPCCTQRAQAYRRTIHASMATALIRIYHETAFTYITPPPHIVMDFGEAWVRFADVLAHNQIADAAKLRYWGLLVEQPETRLDGGRRGLWRITYRGYEFVRGEMSVPRYAVVFDGNLLQLEGEPVTIQQCLGNAFDYSALMRGAA